MAMLIRGEEAGDYNAVAAVNYSAFINWKDSYYKAEPLMPGVLRHSQYFDRELSLVAEEDGVIVGHALFSPFEYVVLGRRKRGVYLAPIAVEPSRQKGGVGARLLEAGHKVAAEKGYAFSMLCGHAEYYPRFGYQAKAFSLAGCGAEVSREQGAAVGVRERPVLASDLPWMLESWELVHRDDRLAWFPGTRITQWFTHSRRLCTSVLERGDKPLAYVKYNAENPARIDELLPAQAGDGSLALQYLLEAKLKEERATFFLSQTVRDCGTVIGPGAVLQERLNPLKYFMIKVLDGEDRQLCGYCSEVAAGGEPGVLSFPAIMSIDDD